jgi:hypothetical protein
MAGSCECGNESSGSIKFGNFLTGWGPVGFSESPLLYGVSMYYTFLCEVSVHVCECVRVCGCGYRHRTQACVCACVALLIQNASRRHIVICALSVSTTFFKIMSSTARFSGKKVTEHKMRVLIFCISLIWNISHSKKTAARYCHKGENVFISGILYSCRTSIKLETSQQIFEKSSNIKFHQNLSSESRVVRC